MYNQDEPTRKSSRRQFAKAIASLAATPLMARALTGGEAAGAIQGQQPEISPAAVALAEVLRHRYGPSLNDEQMNEVKRSLDNRLRAADRMKQNKLANGDEPAFVFTADLP